VTVVELLVTTSLMALVGGATVAALSGGVRVWERAVTFGTQEQTILIAAHQMRRDLRNVHGFSKLRFDGVYDRWSAATVEAASGRQDGVAELGQLGYFLDERAHRLCRSFIPYRMLRTQELTDRCHGVLEGVRRVRFSYYGKDPASGEPGWAQRWEAAQQPMALKAELTVETASGQPTNQTLVIALPGVIEPLDLDDE
jgi:hypothetical protein